MLNNPQLIEHNEENPGVVTKNPEWITINIDGRCNLKCTYCPYHGEQRLVSPKTFFIDYDQFKVQADLAMDFANRVHICAIGEPFLNKDIFRMFDYLNDKGHQPSVLTNGTSVISDKLEQIMDSNLSYFATDVDSLYPDIYKKLCGKDELDNVLSNMGKLAELKAKNGFDTRLMVNTIINRRILPELEGMYHRLNDLGVDSWSLNGLAIPLDGVDFLTRGNSLLDEPETVYPIIKRLRELFADNHMQLEVAGFFDPEVDNNDLRCSFLWRRLMLNVPSPDVDQDKWYGNVVPGCMLSLEGYSLGNMFDSSLNEIWNCDKYVAMRNDLLAGNIHRCKHLCPSHIFPATEG